MLLVPFLVLKLFINYLSIKQKRVPFVFFFSGKMGFPIRVVGGSVGDTQMKQKEREKGELSNPALGRNAMVWDLCFYFILFCLGRTRRPGFLMEKGGKSGIG